MKSVIKQNCLYVKCDEAENTPSLFIFIFLYSCLIKIKINYQCEEKTEDRNVGENDLPRKTVFFLFPFFVLNFVVSVLHA
jgi:hypothetical protein